MANFVETKALTFDLFGTILDLGGSLTPFIDESLKARAADVSANKFWAQCRYRQRIEQYQDTIVMLGHSGYLETVGGNSDSRYCRRELRFPILPRT